MKVPFLKEAIKNLFRKPCTYAVINKVENYRGKIEFDSSKCIGCGLCIRVCAPSSINKEVKKIDDTTQEITMTFDLGSCTFCGMCSEFCAKKAITLTNEFNMISEGEDRLLVKGSFKKTIPKKVVPKK